MGSLQQWRASFCRADGSIGVVYLELPGEPIGINLMEAILRWDTDHPYALACTAPDADRLTCAEAFFEVNHITGLHVKSLDDFVDASSDA